MDKLRLLILLEATLGGTRKYMIDLLERLDLTKFDIEFVYSAVRADEAFLGALPALAASGIRLTEVPMARGLAPRMDMHGFFQIRQIIRCRNPDVVHCHSSKAGFLGRLAAICSGTRPLTVFTPHGLSTHISPFFWLWEKAAAGFTDAAIAVSESEYDDFLHQKLFSHARSRLITLGVDCMRDHASLDIRARLSLPGSAVVVASVGCLSQVKNPIGLFTAAKDVLKRHRHIHFVWIGSGEQRGDVERFLADQELASNCHLLGWHPDPSALLRQCDIFAHTSRYESFGYVLCEAMLEKLPVVATDVMGVKTIVDHRKTGFLVKDEDWAAFADKIQVLAGNPDLRRQMGGQGRERVIAKFNLDKMIGETETLYRDLVVASGRYAGRYLPQ